MEQRKDLFGWFEKKERQFTIAEIGELMERVKEFNAGCIDEYLSNHVDRVFDAWLTEKKED